MADRYTNTDFNDRVRESFEDGHARQAVEGKEAWREYCLQQQAIRDRMEAQRTARQRQQHA